MADIQILSKLFS